MRILGRFTWCYCVLQRHTFCSTLWDMALRSVRFPEELDARLVERAARDDRSLSYLVVKAVEQALGAPAPRADAAPPPRGDAEGGPIPLPAPVVPSRKPRKAAGRPIETSGVRLGASVADRVPARVFACRHCGSQAYEAPGLYCDVHGDEMEFAGVSGARGLLPFKQREEVPADDFDF